MMTPRDSASDARVAALRSWHHDWSGVRVAVLGLGASGFSAADTLLELGSEVSVFSSGHEAHRAELLALIGGTLVVREHPPAAVAAERATADALLVESLAAFDPQLVIVSPGFAPAHPLVAWASEAAVPLWGEVELAWRLRDKVGEPAEWLVLTGASGTETAALLAESMLLSGGRRALACGQRGITVLDAIRDPLGWDTLVVELSARQLRYSQSLSPWVSICLNASGIGPEWHGGEDAALAALARVYESTRMACLYNPADALVLSMVEEADVVEGCRAIGVGLGVPGPSDLGVIEGLLVDRAFHDDRRASALEIATLETLAPAGLADPAGVFAVLVAAAFARSVRVPVEAIHDALLAAADG